MSLLKLELLRWYRSRRIYKMLAVFLIWAVFSVLLTYYLNDIVTFFSPGVNSNEPIVWQNAFNAYFGFSSQFILLMVIYMVAKSTRIDTDESLKLFYQVRAKSGTNIYYPKLVAGLLISLMSGVIGDIVFLGMLSYYFKEVNWSWSICAIIISRITYQFIIVIGTALAVWLKSSFGAAITIFVIVTLQGLFNYIPGFAKWSPTNLLSPLWILYNGIDWSVLYPPLIVGVILTVISYICLMQKTIRFKAKHTYM